MFEKSSEHLWNFLIMLKIGWKSFGNCCWPCFEVVEHLSCHHWLSSEVVGKSSEFIGNLRQSLEVFRKLWQSSEAISKSLEIQILRRRKISRILLKKSWQVYSNMFGICTLFKVVHELLHS